MLAGPGPEIPVHPAVTFFLSFFFFPLFFVISFLQKNMKLHVLQEITLHRKTDFSPSCN